MTENKKSTMYEGLPAVAALNKIQGFDPKKFLRRAVSERTGQEILYLDLKYKKLWFRLAYPKGRIKTTALKITEQLAIIEAKIFFDKNDKDPAASFIAQRNAKNTPGALYIEAAQYAAVDQALIDAGFGLQFCDISHGVDTELLDEGLPLSTAGTPVKTALTEQAVPTMQSNVRTNVHSEPVQEISETVIPEVQPETPITTSTTPAERIPVQVQTPSAAVTESTPPPVSIQPLIQQTNPVQPNTMPMQTAESEVEPVVKESAGLPAYTNDMTVEEICQRMTVDEASALIVEVGTCKGWTLEQVVQRRTASLKWYLNGYSGDDNILRAGAKILLEREQAKLAS